MVRPKGRSTTTDPTHPSRPSDYSERLSEVFALGRFALWPFPMQLKGPVMLNVKDLRLAPMTSALPFFEVFVLCKQIPDRSYIVHA